MQNDQGVGTANTPINQQTGDAPPIVSVGDTAGVSQAIPPPTEAKAPFRLRSGKRWLWIGLGAIVGLFVIGGIFVILTPRTNNSEQQVLSGSYNSVQIPLGDLASSGLSGAGADSLKVNGQLQVSGSMALTPTLQPQNPAKGQLYFDQGSNQLMYYNGQQFVAAGGSSTSTTNNTFNNTSNSTTNVTNIFNSGGGGVGVELQGSTPGIQQSGNFNVSGVGQVGALRTGTVSNGGDLSVTTDAASGTTGNITIKSGDSSTTASGNISIDAGNGIIDGEVVEDKTFESGTDDMNNWFNTTVATTTEQAHSGTQSLKMTPSSNFWGIIETLPGTPVTPGHQYHFSIWVRAAVTGRTVGGQVDWQGAGGATTAFTSITDSTTGWTEMSLTAPAPAGATSVYFKINSSTGITGEAHYFDDITITDLSSSSAFSSIDIGTVNAKVITIGNMNQIGATSILGSSGVTINGGAGNLTMTGGTVGLTGNGASAINTTVGALTLTSANAATWSVGTASSGAGEDLTLHAGAGAFGNNNGGNLVLQGGSGAGTGLGGSVVVRPRTDSTTAFQIQSSANAKLFVADTTNMRLYVGDPAGSTAAVVLVLSNQTTATDPTGVNGAMYYNSSLGKFRCYQQQWRDCIGDDIINTYRYSNEFGNTITGTTGADNTLLSNFSGAGAGAPNAGGEVKHPGISGLNTGTTSTGVASYMSGIPAGSTTLRLGNNVAWTFRSAVRVNQLSTGTDTHTTRVGFIDSNSGESTDGCFFRYTDSINGGKWQGVCRDNNVESTCDTGIAVVAGAWKTMEIGVAADASSANFVVSGVQQCSITTNIPTASGRNTGFGFSIIKSSGTTAAQIDIDFVDIRATGSGFGSRE